MSAVTLLDAVKVVDNYPYRDIGLSIEGSAEFTPFHLSSDDAGTPPLGYIRNHVRDFLLNQWPAGSLGRQAFELIEREGGVKFVAFANWVVEGGSAMMNETMARLALYMKDEGMYPECLDGWRNEKYAIFAHQADPYFASSAYISNPSPSRWRNHAFDLERSACALFGLTTAGVHMTAYVGEGDDMKIWVPRRSATKPTWPGKLDNSVGGGIPSGMTPFESLVKECQEEASLPEELVRKRVKCAGVVTYLYITETGWLQPAEIAVLHRYVYDLPVEPGQILKPFDDEVQGFELWDVTRILNVLQTDPNQFKPNCGLILVDFLIRHGFVTPETEPNLMEITARCKRDLTHVAAMPCGAA